MNVRKTKARPPTRRKLSEIIIEIAKIGFKAAFRDQDPVPVTSHILMMLAVEAWNREIRSGLVQTATQLNKTLEKMRAELSLTQSDFQTQFISTDWETILEMMRVYKRNHFPDDTRRIVACAYTPRETLRVVWE